MPAEEQNALVKKHCAVCHSDDPRDRRTRVGAVVELPAGRLLIDTPPELRLQLIANGVDRADVVLFTHDHADHTHGLDDVRSFAHHAESPLPIYGPAECLEGVQRKFAYVFDPSMRPLKGTSKPEGTLHPVEPGVSFTVLGQAITPVEVPHGRIRVFGYRIGDLGYVTDAKEIPPAAEAVLGIGGGEGDRAALGGLHFRVGEVGGRGGRGGRRPARARGPSRRTLRGAARLAPRAPGQAAPPPR